MARTGQITLREGTSKAGKPYRALNLTIGTWTKLYFVDSQFEMDYIEKYLKEAETSEEVTAKANASKGTTL